LVTDAKGRLKRQILKHGQKVTPWGENVLQLNKLEVKLLRNSETLREAKTQNKDSSTSG